MATKRESRETVLKEQDFDYSFPFIFSRTKDLESSGSNTVKFHDCEDENFLRNIGDV